MTAAEASRIEVPEHLRVRPSSLKHFRGWLSTTRSELDPDGDPQQVRAAIGALRKRHGS